MMDTRATESDGATAYRNYDKCPHFKGFPQASVINPDDAAKLHVCGKDKGREAWIKGWLTERYRAMRDEGDAE